MKNDKSNKVIDKLDGIWKDVYQFLENNKDVAALAPLANFTNSVALFRYDTLYNHPKKQMFVHHSDEWRTFTRPWVPCERMICFNRKENCVVISISSKIKDENVINEQVLVLREDAEGKWDGSLCRLSDKNKYEFYTFDISKNGNVKTRTFKKNFSGGSPIISNKQKTKSEGNEK